MSAKGIGSWQKCKRCGREGRAGHRLRPLFNRTAAAQRPVVIPSWRASPVSLLWPRVSCSPAVSPNLYPTSSDAAYFATSLGRDVTSAYPNQINQWLRQRWVPHKKWIVKLLESNRGEIGRVSTELANECSRTRSPCIKWLKNVINTQQAFQGQLQTILYWQLSSLIHVYRCCELTFWKFIRW